MPYETRPSRGDTAPEPWSPTVAVMALQRDLDEIPDPDALAVPATLLVALYVLLSVLVLLSVGLR